MNRKITIRIGNTDAASTRAFRGKMAYGLTDLLRSAFPEDSVEVWTFDPTTTGSKGSNEFHLDGDFTREEVESILEFQDRAFRGVVGMSEP